MLVASVFLALAADYFDGSGVATPNTIPGRLPTAGRGPSAPLSRWLFRGNELLLPAQAPKHVNRREEHRDHRGIDPDAVAKPLAHRKRELRHIGLAVRVFHGHDANEFAGLGKGLLAGTGP